MAIAGWYPDPHGRHSHRWWDGAAWTEHVADRAVDRPAEPVPVGARRGGSEAVGAPGVAGEPDHAGPLDAGAGESSQQPAGPDPEGYDPEAPFDREPTPVDGRPRERAAAYWADVVARTDPDDLRVQPGPDGRAL